MIAEEVPLDDDTPVQKVQPTWTASSVAMPKDVPEKVAATAAPAPKAAPQKTNKGGLLLRMALPLSRILFVLSMAWLPASILYASLILRGMGAIPAYLYAYTAVIVLVPAIAFVALAMGVQFFAYAFYHLQHMLEGVKTDNAHMSALHVEQIAHSNALLNTIKQADSGIDTLREALSNITSDYEQKLSSFRRDASLRSFANAGTAASTPYTTAPSVPTPVVTPLKTAELTIDDTPHSTPLVPEVSPTEQIENIILRHERHLFDGLHALSIELVRLTDAAASPDLWRRYMRGERDVFTNDFAQRAAHDSSTGDIYRSKEEFRRAVVRYIAQYETLRDRLSRIEQSNDAQHYLQESALGVVYQSLVKTTTDYARAVTA